MKIRELLRAGALALISAMALTACAQASATSDSGDVGEPVYGGDFVSALYLEPLAIDPHRQGYWETYRVTNNILQGLTREDTSGETSPTEIQPELATDWTSNEDGTVWDFTLREGVRFHDGSTFDAESLHLNVLRVSDENYEFYDDESASSLATWFSTLESGETTGDYSYRFTFSEPFLGFPRILAQSMATLKIGNPAVWEQYGNDGFSEHPDGTGPYVFVDRVIGDRIELSKNPDYWGDEPYLDTLTFRIIPNNQTRLAALMSGEVDFISYVQPEDVETLEAQGFQVPEGTGAQLLYFALNHSNPDFADPRVREALIHGLDREKLADELYNGYATPLYSFQPPGNEAYDPAIVDYEYDPARAKELLAEAGYEDGLNFTIVVDVANQNVAEWLQNAYKDVGINVDIVSLDRTSYLARAYNPQDGDGLYLDEYGGTYAEWLHQGYVSLQGRNLDPEAFPEVTASLEAALTNGDPDQRIPLWQAAEEQFRDHSIVIPALNINRYYALGPNVQGFVWPDTNWYDLSKVWLSE